MSAAPPDFSRAISVSQHANGNGSASLVIGCALLGGLGLVIPLATLLDDRGFWSAMLGALALMVGSLLGLALGMALEHLWRRMRGLPALYMATTRVDIGAPGLAVEGLGVVPWCDVLALEGIPDSEHALIVHTRQFEKLMLEAPTDELFPLMSHYMDLHAQGGKA